MTVINLTDGKLPKFVQTQTLKIEYDQDFYDNEPYILKMTKRYNNFFTVQFFLIALYFSASMGIKNCNFTRF